MAMPGRGLLGQHDADADRARRFLPVGDDIGHRRIVWVDRLDDGEPARVCPLHFHRIAGVVGKPCRAIRHRGVGICCMIFYC